MKPEWILVANASRARIVQRTPGHGLELIHAFSHPASRRTGAALGDDRAGHTAHPGGPGGSLVPRMDPRHKEHERFARELAEFIDRAARDNGFGSLVVIAASPFLRDVMHSLSDATHRLLASAHDLDLSAVGTAELEGRIAAVRSRESA